MGACGMVPPVLPPFAAIGRTGTLSGDQRSTDSLTPVASRCVACSSPGPATSPCRNRNGASPKGTDALPSPAPTPYASPPQSLLVAKGINFPGHFPTKMDQLPVDSLMLQPVSKEACLRRLAKEPELVTVTLAMAFSPSTGRVCRSIWPESSWKCGVLRVKQ